jgi:hypothetical protein
MQAPAGAAEDRFNAPRRLPQPCFVDAKDEVPRLAVSGPELFE